MNKGYFFNADFVKSTKIAFVKGFIKGSLGLFIFYFLLLFVVTRDFQHPVQQFINFQPWMSLLIIGFGIQFGLYSLMQNGIFFSLEEKQDAKVASRTGTAVSGLSMVACCAHHLVDLLPILGISAAAVFLNEYQEELLILGVVTNSIGILVMSWFITGKPSVKIIKKLLLK